MKQPVRQFTEERFLAEIGMAAFLGAYKFWDLTRTRDEEYARSVLVALGRIARDRIGGHARTKEEAEAFGKLGIPPRT